MISGVPPTRVATTGKPGAIDSSTELDIASASEGSTKDRSRPTTRERPADVRETRSFPSNHACLTCCSNLGRSAPSPIKTNFARGTARQQCVPLQSSKHVLHPAVHVSHTAISWNRSGDFPTVLLVSPSTGKSIKHPHRCNDVDLFWGQPVSFDKQFAARKTNSRRRVIGEAVDDGDDLASPRCVPVQVSR